MNERHGQRPDTPETEPAPTITSKARTARWYDRRQGHTGPGGARTMVRPIPDSEPAPTIGAMGLSSGRDRWIVADARSEDFAREPRSIHEPAATVGSTARQWTHEAQPWPLTTPATTVAGDPRLTSRSHHEHGEQGREAVGRDEVENGTYDGRSAVRVTLQEAAILQGFPPDYPFQGSRTARFTQVGNAVPPPLAHAVLTALIGELPAPSEAGDPHRQETTSSDASP